MFGGCDGYFAPFINPSENEKISNKSIKDILPNNNRDNNVKVQVLTNCPESFTKFAHKIKLLGYNEVNINLGCPSGTVTNKGRGAGFLRDVDGLDRFLDNVFSHSDIQISVKTRGGYFDCGELETLMQIYNKYPITELIIHPRARQQFYNGFPDYAAFENACSMSVNKVCYNGNVFDKEDYSRIISRFSSIDGVMLGRGAVANPAIFREIKGGSKLTTEELREFSAKLAENYYSVLQSDTFTLHKLKEIWIYIMWNYPDCKKVLKAIKKSNKLSDFFAAIDTLPNLL